MPLHAPGSADLFHILSIEGPPKSGKTELATKDVPGKVAIQSTEHGWDGVIQKQEGWEEKFLVEDYIMNVDLSADQLFADDQKEAAYKAADTQSARIKRDTWDPFKKDYEGAMKNAEVRSVVWDFADEFNEIMRLVNFGKLEKNPQMNSGPVNAEMKNLIRQAHKYKKNLILIHQLKQKYRNVVDVSGREKSVLDEGKFRRAGNDAVNYLVHSFVRTRKVEPVRKTNGDVVTVGKFEVEILSARLNPEVNGMVLEAPTFPLLMMLLAPNVPPENWI